MTNNESLKLSSQDQEVMNLLEEAGRLYEQYHRINDPLLCIAPPDEPSYPTPTWDSPLTLVVKTPK